jgi:hypothetical protein
VLFLFSCLRTIPFSHHCILIVVIMEKENSLMMGIYPLNVRRHLNDGRTLVKCFHNFEDCFSDCQSVLLVSYYYSGLDNHIIRKELVKWKLLQENLVNLKCVGMKIQTLNYAVLVMDSPFEHRSWYHYGRTVLSWV